VTSTTLKRNPKTLVAVGAYSIGKERVYLGIAKALNLMIFADKRRARILSSLEWPELTDRLCDDSSRSLLHVLPISHLNSAKLKSYMQSFCPRYTAVLGFRPTGWTYTEKLGSNLEQLKPQCSGAVTVYGVPYSEHSSFSELQEFVQFLRPQRIIATVNIGTAAQREGMQSHFNQWLRS
jgi:DNA cross-link repair 1A protein